MSTTRTDPQRRRLLQASLLAGSGLLLPPLWAASRARPDAVVSLQPRGDFAGIPNHTSVAAAVPRWIR